MQSLNKKKFSSIAWFSKCMHKIICQEAIFKLGATEQPERIRHLLMAMCDMIYLRGTLRLRHNLLKILSWLKHDQSFSKPPA